MRNETQPNASNQASESRKNMDQDLDAKEIDPSLRPLIKDLWQNGWKTEYCCQGKIEGHRKCPGYIFGTKPDGERFVIRFDTLPKSIMEVEERIATQKQYCDNPNHRKRRFCTDCGLLGPVS